MQMFLISDALNTKNFKLLPSVVEDYELIFAFIMSLMPEICLLSDISNLDNNIFQPVYLSYPILSYSIKQVTPSNLI
jgi:hypothetical protein